MDIAQSASGGVRVISQAPHPASSSPALQRPGNIGGRRRLAKHVNRVPAGQRDSMTPAGALLALVSVTAAQDLENNARDRVRRIFVG